MQGPELFRYAELSCVGAEGPVAWEALPWSARLLLVERRLGFPRLWYNQQEPREVLRPQEEANMLRSEGFRGVRQPGCCLALLHSGTRVTEVLVDIGPVVSGPRLPPGRADRADQPFEPALLFSEVGALLLRVCILSSCTSVRD
eukprot:7280685-Pyramimonas_sp.AAC.1